MQEILVARGTAGNARKKTSAAEIDALRKESSKKVKGIFRCFEPKGGEVTFVYREFKGDPIVRYTMRDGEEYEIPLGVARHLNKNCGYFVHGHILGPDGAPAKDKQNKHESRMNFESVEFYK